MVPVEGIGAGALMDQHGDDPLYRRLDRLEGKARAALVAGARRAAFADALRVGARASVVAPVVLLLLTLVRPIDARAAILLCVAIPCLVLGAAYGLRVARLRVSREAALAWLDRAAGLKDRAVIAAEFARDDSPDGFRAAAIDEARPWLDGAEAATLAATPAPIADPRLWAWPAVAAVLLAGALLIDRGSPGPRGADASTPLRRIAAALGVRPAGQERLAANDASTAQHSAPGGAGGAAPGSGGPAGSTSAAAGTAAGNGSTGAGAGRPAAAMSAGDAGASPAAAAAAGGAGAAGRGAASGLDGRAKDGGQAGTPAGASSKTADAMAADTRATTPQGAAGGAAAGTPPGGAPPASPKAGDDGKQQQSGSRNRSASGQQSSGPGSQGNTPSGEGSNRGNGQEGVKRARGAASLLLAVPMEDRVIGTVNAGSIAVTTRDAPPRSMASGVVAAQSRGSGAPQAGTIPHRPRTVQEDRMLERYFHRAGVDR